MAVIDIVAENNLGSCLASSFGMAVGSRCIWLWVQIPVWYFISILFFKGLSLKVWNRFLRGYGLGLGFRV